MEEIKIEKLFYENGLFRERFYTKSDQGLKHGFRQLWHNNGQIELVITYENGKKHGPATIYNENGQPTMEKYFIQDYEDGIVIEWYKTGQIRRRINYVEGCRHGIYKFWDNNGILITLRKYTHGVEENITIFSKKRVKIDANKMLRKGINCKGCKN